jgi:hypothetical protein
MVITPPERETEFEVQAELYCKLKENGFNVRGHVYCDNNRLDLVVFDKKNIAKCIIEVKNWKPEEIKRKSNNLKTKPQCQKYKKFFLPLLYCVHSNCIDATINRVTEILQK